MIAVNNIRVLRCKYQMIKYLWFPSFRKSCSVNTSFKWLSSSSHDNIVQILGKEKRISHLFGSTFESEVRSMARDCAYTSYFHSSASENDAVEIGPTFTTVGSGKDRQTNSEFDGLLTGSVKSFDQFSAQFKTLFKPFPPQIDGHILLLEVKLNADLLKEWIIDGKKKGSKFLFFKEPDNYTTKLVVINGGLESERFVKDLNAETPPPELVKYVKVLRKAQINVFYKLWTSYESFTDLTTDVKGAKQEAEDVRKELEDVRVKSKKENEEMKIELEDVKVKSEEMKMEIRALNAKLSKLFEK